MPPVAAHSWSVKITVVITVAAAFDPVPISNIAMNGNPVGDFIASWRLPEWKRTVSRTPKARKPLMNILAVIARADRTFQEIKSSYEPTNADTFPSRPMKKATPVEYHPPPLFHVVKTAAGCVVGAK
ncbi:hypothetical protein N0V90_012520 [Kalmusia sp. IMI 367209]|nr:hypothetical protein N0V90_012520 [Kalmusia sp. IMI 367209]